MKTKLGDAKLEKNKTNKNMLDKKKKSLVLVLACKNSRPISQPEIN